MKHKLLFACLLALTCCVPAFSQIHWQHTNGPEGCSSGNLDFDDQFAYFSDQYFLYRSANGLNWEQLPLGNIWPMASYGDVLVAQQGYGFGYDPDGSKFLVSHDHGNTWQEGTMPPIVKKGFGSLAVCTHGIYVADGHQNKIFKTQDEGLTWDFISPPGMFCYNIWAFDDRLYAAWNAKFWRLALNGIDWEIVSPPFNSGDYPVTMFASGNLLFFATESNLYSSNDNGVTWKKTSIQPSNFQDNFVQLGNRVYKAVGGSSIAYTDNGGLSWIIVPNSYYINIGNLGKAGGKLIIDASDKGLYSLDESTFAISPAVGGLNSAPTATFATISDKLFTATTNGVYNYNLSNQVWSNSTPPFLQTHFSFSQIIASPSGKLAATIGLYTDFFYLSSDTGLTWVKTYPFPNSGGFGQIARVQWLDDVLHVTRDSWDVVRSTDFGQTWTSAPNTALRIVPFKGKYWGISSLGIYSSGDLGISWQSEAIPNLTAIKSIFESDNRLFAFGRYGQNHSAMFSSEDGITWQYSNDGLPAVYFSSISILTYQGSAWRYESQYFFHHPNIGFFSSSDTCKTWLPLQRDDIGRLILIDSTFYKGAENGGVFKTGIPQNYGAISSGLVFKDDNNNGIREPGEIPLPNVRVNLREPGTSNNYWFVTSKTDGTYAISSTPNSTDTLRAKAASPYVLQVNPPLHAVTGNSNGRDFGIHLTPDITDVSIVGTTLGKPRPGFQVLFSIQYANEGTLPASGMLSVKLDPNFNFTEATPPPTAQIGTDSLVWNFATTLFETQRIKILGFLKPNVPLGYPMVTRGTITPLLTDLIPSNNSFICIDTVVGSYDPNEKHVIPAKGLTHAEIIAGRSLTYTILFQNTGTHEANRVRISDHLDTALNWSTLRLVAYSHTITNFQLLPGGLLEIVFDNIALPDSNANEAGSHGFVSFSIQRKKAYNPTYLIQNKAAIYFDFNDPIITNTLYTGLAATSVAVHEPKKPSAYQDVLWISPNPAQQYFTVSSMGKLEGAGGITVFNAAGQICARQSFGDIEKPITMNSATFKDGTYLVQLHGKQGIRTGKVIVKH